MSSPTRRVSWPDLVHSRPVLSALTGGWWSVGLVFG